MTSDLDFRITTTRFDEDYTPSEGSRVTTNFANLARGDQRQQNLRNALTMINRRFNDLAHWDNPTGDRYELELDIVSAELRFADDAVPHGFPLIEVLDITIVDRVSGERRKGIIGNNFSSYVRDYDFSVRLAEASEAAGGFSRPDDFGDLHGKLFQHFLDSAAYRERSDAAPVVCISVSSSKTYLRTDNHHPVLGVEYRQDEASLTDDYFGKMGLNVRYFMPPRAVAPLALYHRGDLLNDYTNLQLAGTISTMETFQRIYRPEIYNANSAAASVYRPSLDSGDFSQTKIAYDREERSRLGAIQGKHTHETLIKPHGDLLDAWAAERPVPVA